MKNLKIFLVTFLLAGSVFAAIPQKQSGDFASQIAIAQNPRTPMSARWQALIAAAEVAKYDQIEEIKAFAKNKDWYMRNASLVALEKININHAMEEAQTLLQDKALVVRSAAVDVLSHRYTRENRDLLAMELAKPYNFSRKQSLWIRPKIFNIMAARATGDERLFFARYLFDTDDKITHAAVATLERITETHLNDKNQLNAWREYVKKNGWL
jgi:hypothetical protein